MFATQLNNDKNREIDQAATVDDNVIKSNESTVITKFDPKSFYQSTFYNEEADRKCFQQIESQSNELLESINEAEFQFKVSHMKEKKLKSFIEKLKNTNLFLICFEILAEYTGKRVLKLKPTDLKVRPEYLEKIENMCIQLGDSTIYYFKSNNLIQQFVSALNRYEFEFVNENVNCVCFDSKFAYKIMKSCFEFDEKSLSKIYWYDVKCAHWLIDCGK